MTKTIYIKRKVKKYHIFRAIFMSIIFFIVSFIPFINLLLMFQLYEWGKKRLDLFDGWFYDIIDIVEKVEIIDKQ